ncbi:hypothetical protein [Streptomyces sp. NPDC093109]|uniref:hypothetical protein n=1 Tax=Streptomyces sp. NPDC093109 TaxID=3154977 RepID=UPI00344B75B9
MSPVGVGIQHDLRHELTYDGLRVAEAKSPRSLLAAVSGPALARGRLDGLCAR